VRKTATRNRVDDQWYSENAGKHDITDAADNYCKS
jgi:hypothetical protein